MPINLAHSAYLHNSFPVAEGAGHPPPIKEVFDMHTQQATTFPIFDWRPLQIVVAAWNRASKWLSPSVEPAAEEPIGSELPADIRYDVGDLDCRIPARQFTESAGQQTLEGMWLRYR
jgi:hypothetical protein